uniref:Uncharacterized protein n=1 Tax=Anguilla anguilla TaxID=7936 RepID=A0A0E9T2X7_ANGAN
MKAEMFLETQSTVYQMLSYTCFLNDAH